MNRRPSNESLDSELTPPQTSCVKTATGHQRSARSTRTTEYNRVTRKHHRGGCRYRDARFYIFIKANGSAVYRCGGTGAPVSSSTDVLDCFSVSERVGLVCVRLLGQYWYIIRGLCNPFVTRPV